MKMKLVYKSEDGKEFDTEQQCLTYEYDLCQQSKTTQIKKKLEKLVEKYCDNTDYEGSDQTQIADFIYQKFGEIEEIVNEFN
jgi:ribosomal protein S3AE